MRHPKLIALLIFSCPILCSAQSLPPERRSDWHAAGRPNPIPNYATVLNILDFGGSDDSTAFNEVPFQQAEAALQGQPGVIFFPAGVYRFQKPIRLRDSLIVRGAGADQTLLCFDLEGLHQHCVIAAGSISAESNSVFLTQDANRGDTILYAQSGFKPGDFVRLQYNDSLIVYSSWALGSTGQLLEVLSSNADQLQMNHALRLGMDLSLNPRLRKINPVDDAGMECLKIKRLDPNVPLGSNVIFEYARRCWLSGLESETCNFAHVTFDASAHCEVYGCYMHDAFAYGGNGQGYGVVLEFVSSDNRIQNSIFQHLRHSMLLQSGANGNVLGYNFSTDPYWDEFPHDAAGDIVLHGNYPSYNLFEGNICENIRPDGSHGNNGPYNTIFRNRSTGYGLITTEPNYQHSLNILANEIVSGGVLQGLYIVSGTDLLEQGNSQNGNIIPVGTPVQTDTSLYFKQAPAYLSGTDFLLGPPAVFNSNSIPAKDRFLSGATKTDCEAGPGLMVGNPEYPAPAFPWELFPNPAQGSFTSRIEAAAYLEVVDFTGKPYFAGVHPAGFLQLDCQNWPSGIYFLRMKTPGKTPTKTLIKLR